MFCEKCGNQIPEGSRFCINCGSPVEVQPVQQPVQVQYRAPEQVQYQAPMQPQYEAPQQVQYQQPAQMQYQYQQPQQYYQQPQQPAFEVSRPANGKRSGGKKKGGKAGWVIAAVVLVALIACVVLFWNAITGFALRNFGDPTEYMVYVEKNSAEPAVEALCQVYGDALDRLEEPQDMAADITLRPGESVIALLETAMAQEGMSVDMDWLQEINLSADLAERGSLQAMDVVLGVNDKNVATVKAVVDKAGGKIYISFPELNGTWVEVDAGVSDTELGMTSDEILSMVAGSLPDGETLEKLLDKYTGLIIENLGEAEKRTETFEVEGVEQKLMVLHVELTQREVVELACTVLQQAREDEELLRVMDKLSAAVNTVDSSEFVDLRTQLVQTIDEALAEMEMARAEAGDDVVLVLETAVDDSHRIVGRFLEFPETQESMYCLMTVKGTEFGFGMDCAGAVVKGSGSLSAKGVEGSFAVYAEGMKLMTVELEGMSLKDEELNGTLILRPESSLLDEAGMDSSVTSLLGGNLGIRVELGGKTVDLSVLAGSSELLGMALTGKESAIAAVSVPEAISATDEAAIMEWAAGLDLTTVIGNLEDAGAPQELVDILNTVAQLLAYM